MRAAALAAMLPLGALSTPALAQEPLREKAIQISRAGSAHEWPFSVERGELKCFIFAGRRMVLFTEPDGNDPDWFFKDMPYEIPRSVILSTNPLEIFASLEDADLFLPFDSDLAVLIARLAPYVVIGQALCDEILAEGGFGAADAGEDEGGEIAGDGN